jgi:hypothetical protein
MGIVNIVKINSPHDCMDAGGRTPTVGALGDAWSNCREGTEDTEKGKN